MIDSGRARRQHRAECKLRTKRTSEAGLAEPWRAAWTPSLSPVGFLEDDLFEVNYRILLDCGHPSSKDYLGLGFVLVKTELVG